MNERSDIAKRDLPEGTVTFLFTDIEGSTELLRKLGEDYMTLLADHHQILRTAFNKRNGQEVDTEGDAFFVSFRRATDAVNAVVDAQRAFAAHTWPLEVTVRVRMGLHTGEPWTAQEGYVGMDVHRAARIAHIGHGGQVMLSETTAPLLKEGLPEGVTLLDLGLHRLKDMEYPEHIRQLVIPGLPSQFPPLKSIEALGPEVSAEESARLPAFLEDDSVKEPEPVFVGRERELDRLFGQLDGVQEGQGGVYFVAGDAGSGKTALLDAFSRKAQERIPDLLVMRGTCNAFTGSGDPYAPFRTVLRQLTGDVETAWKGGLIQKEGATRLWSSIPIAVKALLRCGPNLFDTFIPGPALFKRVSIAVPADGVLLEKIKELMERKDETLGSLEQQGLFEEVRDFLVQLSEIAPLLILLDDMQWADSGSINLLFHLGRELAGARVLLANAYRPEDVALGRDDSKHPLEPVLNELKRTFGDIWVDLNQIKDKSFVDDFINSEPNHLGDTFREKLYEHTAGHALFTIELLRDLQERGDLTKDIDGIWIEGPGLDWTSLPSRVAGVIENRIDRLEDELREMLSVAAVEGENFTAQVVARVQKIQERRLLSTLSKELWKRHKLVKEGETVSLGSKMLSRYRFSHALFQRYLYNDLSAGERRVLHGEIAAVLEELYSDHLDEIAVQLGSHYAAANDGTKASGFLTMAGDTSRSLHAFAESCQHYEHALEFLRKDGRSEQTAATLMKLGLAYFQAHEFDKSRNAYDEGFELWRQRAILQRSETLPQASHPYRLIGDIVPDRNRDPAMSRWKSRVVENLFSGLVKISPDWSVVPDVAMSWEILDDGRSYIYHLRDDVYWSDGKPVTAYDFEFAMKRILDPKTESPIADYLFDVEGALAFKQGVLKDSSQVGIKAQDNYTLTIQLGRPTSYFLQLLMGKLAYPVPEHVIAKHGSFWTKPENIVTNGPYLLPLEQPDNATRLVRNPYYHGQAKGNVEEIISFEDLDKKDSYLSYLNDEIDELLFINLPYSEKERARIQFGEDYSSEPNLQTYFLFLNPHLAPFDNRNVRLAMIHALHRAIPAYGGGHITKTCGMIPPGLLGHNPALGYAYDLERARFLLSEAGFCDGASLPVISFFIPGPYQEVSSLIIDVMNEDLGVDIHIDTRNDYSSGSEIFAKNHIVILNWGADYPDPDNFMRVCLTPILQVWRNDEYLELIERGRRSMDHKNRMHIYKEADRQLVNDAVIVPLYYGRDECLMKPWIRNRVEWPWKDVIIDPH